MRPDAEKAASSDQKDAIALLAPVRPIKIPEINSEELKVRVFVIKSIGRLDFSL